MAVCNIFKKLTKETGTFLTFSQYMEDLTLWQTESKYHRIVPSKFIAIDCKQTNYTNITLPKYIQEYFENACACFKNNLPPVVEDEVDSMALGWSPDYTKTLFWNMMFKKQESIGEGDSMETFERGLIDVEDIKYVGDINLQSYNEVDSMGYSEIYCHIPNEASSYKYDVRKQEYSIMESINRKPGDKLEGFSYEELNGWEELSTVPVGFEYHYLLDNKYDFTWNDKKFGAVELKDKSFNINMIVVLYDIWNDNSPIFTEIPMGIYITGLIDDNLNITNSITKYVSNEDIYNAGTSYGLRICSRYIVAPGEDRYIVKNVTVEDNNYSDLSRVLSQLSISQNKMDEVVNKTYNTEQNYKNLLSIFKNNRTNVPYIKIVNNESCWFVNGKLIGPSVVDGVYDAYSNDEIDYLMNSKLNQAFQIIATARDEKDRYIFERFTEPQIILKWDVYYEGKKIRPTSLWLQGGGLSQDVTGKNLLYINLTDSDDFILTAKYGKLECSTTTSVYFVNPTYFGELDCREAWTHKNNTEWGHEVENDDNHDKEHSMYYNFDWIKNNPSLITNTLPKYITNTSEHTYEVSTDPSNPGHICYAYPADFGELAYIKDRDGYIYYNFDLDAGYNKDQSSIENTFFFIKDLVLKPYGDQDEVKYNVYVSKVPTYVNNLQLVFKNRINYIEI